MSINHGALRETMRRSLVGGQYGAVQNGMRYIETSVRDMRMTAEDGVEFLRSVRDDWTRVPSDCSLIRNPNPRYWALRQEITRATLRIADGRRWDATRNRKPPLWNQCTLGDPEALPRSQRPCHAFTFAKMRRGPGWTLQDAVREFRRASSNRYHGTGGTCAILAEEIAEQIVQSRALNIRVQNPVSDTSLHDVHALITAARDHHTQKSRHSGMWIPSFQRYCQWWQQIFEVALYQVARYRAQPHHP